MKKLFKIVLCLTVMFMLVSCGNKKQEEPVSDFTWTREGYFVDENEDLLMVYKSDTEGYEGWSVSYKNGEDMYGWIIQQEGDSLHGDLLGYEEGSEYIVTVREEGEDGLLLITPDNVEHHFKAMEMPEVIATITINVDGLGEIAYAGPGEEFKFDDEYPFQSAVINIAEPATYTIGARPDEGYRFVKWTLNGEDYSTEEIFTVELSENSDFVAVFEQE